MLLSVQKDNILLSIPSCRCSELGELERSTDREILTVHCNAPHLRSSDVRGLEGVVGMGGLVVHVKEVVGRKGVVVGGLGRRGGEILTVASPQALAEV